MAPFNGKLPHFAYSQVENGAASHHPKVFTVWAESSLCDCLAGKLSRHAVPGMLHLRYWWHPRCEESRPLDQRLHHARSSV